MIDKYTALRNALAAGPTPGPWKAVTGPGRDYGSTNYGVSAPPPHYWVVPTLNIPKVNTEYIAAASPDTLAALLAERDALRDALDGLPSATTHPAVKTARTALAMGDTDGEI